MKIGITGTREGMSEYQVREVYDILNRINTNCRTHDVKPSFHHGDCLGVDVEAAAIAKSLGYTINGHPPSASNMRGFFQSDFNCEPAGYLQRDRAIVDTCDFLLVVPLQMEWQPKGGTWYTHDYAAKKNKPLVVIFPRAG